MEDYGPERWYRYTRIRRPRLESEDGRAEGSVHPFATVPLKENDEVLNILASSVIGSIAEHLLAGAAPSTNARVAAAPDPGSSDTPDSLGLVRLPPTLQDLLTAFDTASTSEAIKKAKRQGAERASRSRLPPWGAYEARVLQGIWAAAPYLHNGSVPTLAELLKPSGERKSQFSVGRKYDIENVGLAATQEPLSETLSVTDCSNINSGNSRCGHEYGTSLSDQDKRRCLNTSRHCDPLRRSLFDRSPACCRSQYARLSARALKRRSDPAQLLKEAQVMAYNLSPFYRMRRLCIRNEVLHDTNLNATSQGMPSLWFWVSHPRVA
ncbi:hypothetical protein [Bradyrhizobium septentrionale]|uniref:c-type cytochrome n=1 Tax=Bradyrhizobium septentrionale TaxID=1404411 RepID=UPI00308400A5